MPIKSLVLDYMSGSPGFGVPPARLEACTHSLRAFVGAPQYDAATICANDSRFTRISIVMPSYNQARFIERSILSVLNQDYPNLQFIIMDGGSTDGTVDIIRRYEKYLVWRSEPDRGQSDAINKALTLADGELIGWLNSDDVYFPGVFHRLHVLSQGQPRAMVYSGSVAMIDDQDGLMRVARYGRPSKRRLLHEGFIMQSQGVFWRRLPGSPPVLCDPSLHYAMDLDLFLKLLDQGPAKFLPELTGGLRFYPTTKTASAPEKGREEVAVIRKRYGVNDATTRWRLVRNALFCVSLFERIFMTRRHCVLLTQPCRHRL